MASVNIQRKNPKNKRTSLFVKLTDGRGVTLRIPTGISIYSNHFTKKGKVMSADNESVEKNTFLDDMKKNILDVYLKAKNQGVLADEAYIKEKVKPRKRAGQKQINAPSDHFKVQQNPGNNVMEQIQRFIVTPNNHSESYMRGAHQLKQHLGRFLEIREIDALSFVDLSHFFLQEYNHYLEKNKTDKYLHKGKEFRKQCLKSGTRSKHFQFLGKIAKSLRGSSIEINPAVFEFGVTEVNEDSRHLDWEELKLFMAVDASNRQEILTKDIFTFMCFSGLRVTAVQNLNNKDISRGFIEWVNTKSRKRPTVYTTINRYSATIIKKYRAEGKLFPNILQSYLNEKVKILAERAGIENPHKIKNHTGRHTYNNLLRSMGMDIYIRNSELGHSHGNVNEDVYSSDETEKRKAVVVDGFERIEEILAVRAMKAITLFDDI